MENNDQLPARKEAYYKILIFLEYFLTSAKNIFGEMLKGT